MLRDIVVLEATTNKVKGFNLIFKKLYMEENKEINKKIKSERLLIICAGLIFGAAARLVIKGIITFLGYMFQVGSGMYDDNMDMILKIITEIFGFIVLVWVFRKIYKEEFFGKDTIKNLSEKGKIVWKIVSKIILVVIFIVYTGALNLFAFAQFFLHDFYSNGERIALMLFVNTPGWIIFIVLYKFINKVFKNNQEK